MLVFHSGGAVTQPPAQHFSTAHTTTAVAPLSTPHFSFMQKLRGISASEEAFLKLYPQTSLLDHGKTTEMMPLIERM